MFVIMYEFIVKTGQAEHFTQLWHNLTLLVTELSDSHGSRLHQASDTTWIGYAEWPSRDSWENSDLTQNEIAQLREQISAACDDIQIIYQLDVVDDLLIQKKP
jgi:hypothetical protein